jgi:hypothetical protein
LHVLGLPPAFVLSQDQTLKLDENLFWLVTVFEYISKLMHNLTSPKHTCLRASSKITMNLINVTAKSLPHIFALRICGARTSPSTFLFLPIQLSNSKAAWDLIP